MEFAMKLIIALFSALALASPTLANEAPVFEPTTLNVAYPALAAGQNRAAIAQILADKSVAANDPSRLINLGSAYARIGRTDLAEAMFRAAIRSDIRYDLELANGTMMDSRMAARLALAGLSRSYATR